MLDAIPKNLTIGIVILVMTILAFYKGRKVLYSLLVAFFPSVLLYQAFTNWSLISSMLPADFFSAAFTYRLVFFIIVYIFMFFITQKIIAYEINRYGMQKMIDSILLSLGLVCESSILIFQVLSLPDFYHLSSPVEVFLASSSGNVIMLLVAVFSLMYSSRA